MTQQNLQEIRNIILGAFKRMTSINITQVAVSEYIATATNAQQDCEVFNIKLSVHGQTTIRPVYFHFD